MTDGPSRWSTCRDLDASPTSGASIAWLDRVAALAPLRAGKERSHELLGVGAGARVLDVGCGTGVDIPSLAALLVPGGEVVGVDASARALAQAEQTAAQLQVAARFEQADAAQLPFEHDSFDACRCDRTIQHLPDPHVALREMVRVTRPGGTILISEGRNHVVDGQGGRLHILDEFLALHQAREERGGWIGAMLPLLLTQAGLADVRVEIVRGDLTEPDDIASFYDLPDLSERAVQEGHMTAAQATGVLDAVQRESREGRLKVTLETYIFVGQVPRV